MSPEDRSEFVFKLAMTDLAIIERAEEFIEEGKWSPRDDSLENILGKIEDYKKWQHNHIDRLREEVVEQRRVEIARKAFDKVQSIEDEALIRNAETILRNLVE